MENDIRLTKNNLLNEFLKFLPELKDEYVSYLKSWNEFPGFHNIFGDILNPYIEKLLENKNKNKEILKRIFNFLEIMANSQDVEVLNVLNVTILENLDDNEFMLQKTKKLFLEMNEYWDNIYQIKN